MPDNTYLTAPIWRRLAALLYDLFILLALSMLYGAAATIAFILINGSGEHDYTPMLQGNTFRVGWGLTLAGFYIYFWRRAGQTVGMRAWRITLVNESGSTPSLKQCAVRAVIGPITISVLGLGYLWALLDPNRDCLHDKISGTRVLFYPKN